MSTEKTSDGSWFCVIGPNVVQSHPIKRSWKNSQEEAVAHAERLIRNSFDGSKAKVQKLLVVKVVEVVEIEGPPITKRTGIGITRDDIGGRTDDDDD
jgi:hypothetical protein